MNSLCMRAGLTYAATSLGGYVCWRLGVPLPWMVGPVVVAATMSVAGLPLAASVRGRNLGMIIAGSALGLYFTPEALHKVADNMAWILAAVLATVLISCLASLMLARTARMDRATAFLCSVPGGVAEMCMLAQRYGASQAPIAVSQLLRLILLVSLLPTALLLAGVEPGPRPPGGGLSSMPGLLALLAVSAAATIGCARAGMLNAWLLIPLAVGMMASLSELHTAAPPMGLIALAQVLIGTQLGSAFRRKDVLAVRPAIAAIVVNVLTITAGCAMVGYLLAQASGNGLATLILATAPGGVTEMSLTAKSMGLDVPLVVGFHVLRVFITLLATPWIFTMLRRLGVISLPSQTGIAVRRTRVVSSQPGATHE